MRCASCAAENKTGRHFCAACGAVLPHLCAACGFANDPGDAFCGGCGRDLGHREPTGETVAERRPVSIMFADLVGYTALAEKVERGELREVDALPIGQEVMRDNALELFPQLKDPLWKHKGKLRPPSK